MGGAGWRGCAVFPGKRLRSLFLGLGGHNRSLFWGTADGVWRYNGGGGGDAGGGGGGGS